MKIYIVLGNTGEYSDFKEWIVCAYKDEVKAKNRVIELETLLKSFKDQCKESDFRYDYEVGMQVQEEMRKSGDPRCEIDYTWTRYHYEETDLKD